MKKELLTLERANELLRYDLETGRIFWKVSRRGPAKVGAEAGNVYVGRWNLYRRIRVDGKIYKAHRLAWLLYYGVWPEQELDHIDGDGLNNRSENLRDVSVSINQRNAKMRCTNTTGVTGVDWYKIAKKWRASAQAEGKKVHLGYFENLEEAEMVVKNFRLLHGFTERHGEKTS